MDTSKTLKGLGKLTIDVNQGLEGLDALSTSARSLREDIEKIIEAGTDEYGDLDPWHDLRGSLLLLEQSMDNFTRNTDEVLLSVDSIVVDLEE